MANDTLLKYQAWILDFDGTLYHQFPVRVHMLIWLLGYYLVNPLKIRELCILREYRRLREELFGWETEDFQQAQMREAARKYHVKPQQVEALVHAWMIRRPLNAIRRWRRRRLISLIKLYQDRGGVVIVYSDYPVSEKLKAIDLSPHCAFWSGDSLIRCMKPNPRGLENILASLRIRKEDVLYIGDREDRDALCAQRAGVDYRDVNVFERLARSALL